jgi:hypothetical protein
MYADGPNLISLVARMDARAHIREGYIKRLPSGEQAHVRGHDEQNAHSLVFTLSVTLLGLALFCSILFLYGLGAYWGIRLVCTLIDLVV